MSAGIIIGNETISADGGISIERAMVSAGKHPDAFLFFVGGRPVPMTTILTEGMTVTTLRVASGG